LTTDNYIFRLIDIETFNFPIFPDARKLILVVFQLMHLHQEAFLRTLDHYEQISKHVLHSYSFHPVCKHVPCRSFRPITLCHAWHIKNRLLCYVSHLSSSWICASHQSRQISFREIPSGPPIRASPHRTNTSVPCVRGNSLNEGSVHAKVTKLWRWKKNEKIK